MIQMNKNAGNVVASILGRRPDSEGRDKGFAVSCIEVTEKDDSLQGFTRKIRTV